MKNIKAHWYINKNVGDTLTPILVEYFTGRKVEYAERTKRGKLLGVGSIMNSLRENDTVWGTGVIKERGGYPIIDKCKILATRGKLTEKILGIECGIYGDPALLLPLIYNPDIKSTKEIGYCPHYIHKNLFKDKEIIDVFSDWKYFINELLKYEKIETSSLHGFIIALVYGRYVKWVKYDDRVIGDGFKFRDFGTGIGLDIKENIWYKGISNLKEIQDKLIKVLQDEYK
jgi:pyruvyltransferase